jgi:hypothetical protein
MSKLLQRISRIILGIFALILLFTGGMNFQRYLTEHKELKTPVSGLVVKVKGEKKIAYSYQGEPYQEVPVANVLKNFGKVGSKVTVYVNNHRPEKIYMKKGATSLLILASVMTGWAIFIALVLFFEYWFIHKMKEMIEE